VGILAGMTGSPQEHPLLRSVNSPADLRRLCPDELPALAGELRDFLVDLAARRGGYLAESLGAVELAIALHYAYKTPHDRLIWDGGQQAIPHHILTGRRHRLHEAGRAVRPAPLPARTEDDIFGVGHLGTAISAATGVAVAAAHKGSSRRVVAVVSERSLTAGMSFEALNHAGSLPRDLLVILNDSQDASGAGIGALSAHFARALSGPLYLNLRKGGKRMLRDMPTMRELARRSEKHLKGMVLPGTLFEEMGFNYLGPIDGHDVKELVRTLTNVQGLHGPQFLHIVTRRGRGYAPAEADPKRFEQPPPFEPRSGAPLTPEPAASYADVFGQWACEMAARDPAIVCVATAARESLGLEEFARCFPGRYFDSAVAEQHAVTFAAGLATAGCRPVLAIHSTFLQRAYDQLIHDVALQKLPVLFAVDGAGLTGSDGATHQGSYDLSYLRCVPNLTIAAPADENELRHMLYTASGLAGPALVRYPRAAVAGVPLTRMSPLAIGRGEIRREGGSGLALLAFGTLLEPARRIAERLDATLVNMRFVKPLDEALLRSLCAGHEALVTLEENAVAGGAGSAVGELLRAQGIALPQLNLGIPDRFIGHGSREGCLAAAGLDLAGLNSRIERFWSLPQRRQLARGA